LGYELAHPEFRASHIITYRHAVTLGKPGKASLDIHWRLLNPFYHPYAVPMGWFWQTALPVHIGDASA